MRVLQAKSQEKNCTGRYSKGLKNQNGKYLVNLCESINLETQLIFPMVRELARTLVPFDSTKNIKIKVTYHRVIRDGHECIWEGILFMNIC